jgi:hypothetical protein
MIPGQMQRLLASQLGDPVAILSKKLFVLFFPIACQLLHPEPFLLAALQCFAGLGPFGRTAFAPGNEVRKDYSFSAAGTPSPWAV